jgi:ELWxxDGT repeat protein
VTNPRNPTAPQYPLYPENLTVANGKLFFSADDGIHGKELWTSDGTAVGTSLVVDLYQGEGIPFVIGKGGPTQNYPGLVPQGNDASPRDLVFVDNVLYFTATDGSGRKLWQLPIGPNGEPGGVVPGPVTPPIGNNGDDIVYGTIGDDKINVGNGWNRVYASEGRNFVQSGSGDDGIYGGSSTDVFLAGDGRNEIYAGEGLNLVVTGNGYDQIYGGAGTDITIAGEGFNAIYAGEGDNLVIGGNDGNHVYLGAGNDFVKTGSGHDTIDAGAGHNYIDAGNGWNKIYTGSGADSIVLNQGDGFNIITNFDLAHDQLGLVDGLTVGDLSARQIDSWGYLTEISVTRTGDVLAQLEGIHVTPDQLHFTNVDNSGSGFKRLTAGLLDQAFSAAPDATLLSAGLQASHVNGLMGH